MEDTFEAAEKRPAPQAELSLEISRVVSRVVAGETIDTVARGKELAARFPGAGMSGDMIAEAIVSAAGMVGLIRDGGAAPMSRVAAAREENAALPSEEELSTASETELGEFAAGQTPGARPNGNGAASDEKAVADSEQPLADTERTQIGMRASIAHGALAAVRRALFRG